MTVRFKGITEYQNKYKARPRRVKSASPQRRMRLAGVRSDQLGISREPQFQSKRRAPFYPPQVSSSLKWRDSAGSLRQQDIARPDSPPVSVHVTRTSSPEKVETPLAPRTSKPQQAKKKTTQRMKDVPCSQVRSSSADQQEQEHLSNGLNHALRKKAGLSMARQKNGRQSSEYQRQFLWKTPAMESPLLAAQQMLYTSNRSIPPFKFNPVEMETEYKRSFKGSPPPRPPQLRRDVELNEVPLFQRENISSDKHERKKRKEQHHTRNSRSIEDTHQEPQPLQQEVTAPQKDASPKVVRKVKTEYTSNFRSPLQYYYRDGTWVRSRVSGEEVRDLRAKAEAYRKRAWGTHFSRQHLSQVMSEQNCLWEASSASSSSTLTEQDSHSHSSPTIEALDLARVDSVRGSCSPGASVSLSTSRRSSYEGVGLSNGPTLPLQRKHAWDEEERPYVNGVAEIKPQREEPPVQQAEESDEEEDRNEDKGDNLFRFRVPVNEPSSPAAGSRSSVEEGRLPTPKLKNMLAVQRTHHDRTTPTIGGAVLVSPPKTKNFSRTARKSEAPLGKVHSPFRHLSHGSPPRAHSKAENGSLSRSSPAAGIATVDPLPLRDDTWAKDTPEPSPEPKPARTPQRRTLSATLVATSSPHANRIQGTLRNPEFQHNGNLGLHRPDQFVFPSSDSGVSDNDDRMSQISFRSAASCSMASEVLDRAQRRKEDFWGKS